MLIHNGWYFRSTRTRSRVIRCGSTAGILVPIRTNSMCGIDRKRPRIQSSLSSLSASGSPPEISTSRTVGRFFQVAEDRFQTLLVGNDFAVAHHARPRAIAAVGRTEVERQQQDAIGIAMHQAGYRAVAVFTQRIVGFAECPHKLLRRRNDGLAQRLIRIVRVKQAHVVGSHADRQHRSALRAARPVRRPTSATIRSNWSSLRIRCCDCQRQSFHWRSVASGKNRLRKARVRLTGRRPLTRPAITNDSPSLLETANSGAVVRCPLTLRCDVPLRRRTGAEETAKETIG